MTVGRWAAGVFFLTVGALSGCVGHAGNRVEAQIAPDLRFAVPAPSELGYGVTVEQLVTARFGGETQVFQAHLAVSPERLTMIALDGFGRRVFTLSAGDAGMALDRAPAVPAGLSGANILADVAIVYWPEAAVRRALYGSAAVLESGDRWRAILVDRREVIRVSYDAPPGSGWASIAHYRNNAFGYELDLQSRRVDQ